MSENNTDTTTENSEKKEYSAGKDYNKSISRPNLNLNSNLGINIRNFDSISMNNVLNKNKILQDEPVKRKKEDDIPEISEVYGDNTSFKEEVSSDDSKKNKGNLTVKKVAPEVMVAIITGVLLVFFMILSVILYNLFTK